MFGQWSSGGAVDWRRTSKCFRGVEAGGGGQISGGGLAGPGLRVLWDRDLTHLQGLPSLGVGKDGEKSGALGSHLQRSAGNMLHIGLYAHH
jgi:hypothetical protein